MQLCACSCREGRVLSPYIIPLVERFSAGENYSTPGHIKSDHPSSTIGIEGSRHNGKCDSYVIVTLLCPPQKNEILFTVSPGPNSEAVSTAYIPHWRLQEIS